MPPPLLVDIATPERVVLSRQVVSVMAPGVEGHFGIMARHAPLFAALDVGELKLTMEDETEEFAAISGGFLEVRDNVVSVLSDTAELSYKIDEARAQQARDRAQERLGRRSDEVDFVRAQLALRKALNRLRVLRS